MYKSYEPFVKANKIKIYQRPLCQVESSFLKGAPSINEVRRISRHSCQSFCSISSVEPQGLCVWSNSLKGGAGNTYMPLHDHPFSDVSIIYSVVQPGERTTDRGTNSAQTLKGSVTGNTDLDNYTYYLVE
jgi:hypothetical protein